MFLQPDFAAARTKAQEVLEGNVIVKPPVVAHALAENYDLKVEYWTFKPEYSDVAGFIEAASRTIAVNADDPLPRQNFTIAHELGHYLLGHDLLGKEYSCLFRNPTKQKKNLMEQEANYFAIHLLVPTKMLRTYLEQFPFASDEQLSRIFGVSADIIGLRRSNI